MGGVLKTITKVASGGIDKVLGIDPTAQNDAIQAAAAQQAKAATDAANQQAAAQKAASDAAVTQANEQAKQTQAATNAQAQAAALATSAAINQQNAAAQAQAPTSPDKINVDLSGNSTASDDELAKRRNPRAAYNGASGGTGIRLS